MVDLLGGLQTTTAGVQNIADLSVYILVTAAIIFLIMLLIRNLKRYNVDVEIIEEVGDGTITLYDQGWIRRKNGVPKLSIRKLKRDEPIPKAHLFQPVKKRFGWNKLIRFYKSGETLTPLGITINSPASLTPFIDSDVELWYALETQKAYETYNQRSIFEIYGPYMAFGSLFVLIFIMGIIFFEQFGVMAEAFRGAAASLASAQQPVIQQIPAG